MPSCWADPARYHGIPCHQVLFHGIHQTQFWHSSYSCTLHTYSQVTTHNYITLYRFLIVKDTATDTTHPVDGTYIIRARLGQNKLYFENGASSPLFLNSRLVKDLGIGNHCTFWVLGDQLGCWADYEPMPIYLHDHIWHHLLHHATLEERGQAEAPPYFSMSNKQTWPTNMASLYLVLLITSATSKQLLDHTHGK